MYVEVNMESFPTTAKLISMNRIVKGSLLMSLIANNIDTMEDLLKYNVEELLKIDGISLFSIAVLKKKLNELGYHLKGEEIVEYTDYYDSEKEEPLKCCDVIVKKKRELEKRIREVENEMEIEIKKIYRGSPLLKEYQTYLDGLYNLEKELDYAFVTLLNYVQEKREKKLSQVSE